MNHALRARADRTVSNKEARLVRKTAKTIITGIAAVAAVPAFGLAVATSAGAAGDTADDHWVDVFGGWVMWNDYDSQWHDKDLDNIWVEDAWGDGNSLRLRVKWDGDWYTTHAYNGDVAKISVGNVPNGERVFWEACEWDDGDPTGWCKSGWFYE